jgi:DNA-binding transcriptional regulator GbsR (MarR family)
MDEISSRLKISMGSTSQGLKTLRSLKAIRTSYVQGDRKDHYIAETEFRRLFSNFIKEDILPHLDSAADRISSMEKHVIANPDMNQEFYTTRIEKLKRLTKAGRKLLPALAGLLKI